MDLLTFLAALISGVAGSMGLGGGSVLILYLTLVLGTDRVVAGGVNLLFFLPVAAVSVIMNLKNKIYSYKEILPISISGCVFSVVGTFLAFYLKSKIVSVVFGVFLVLFGAREIIVSILKNNWKKK